MTFMLVWLIFLLGGFLGKVLFRSFYNHLSIYSIIWLILLSSYELRLIRYVNLSAETWFVIFAAYLSLVLGTITYFLTAPTSEYSSKIKAETPSTDFFTLNPSKIKVIIFLFSILGIFAALQHWGVLFQKYGNLVNIFLNGTEIYRLRVEGKLVGVIPYIHAFSFAAVFFAAIYSAQNEKFSLLLLPPFLGIILKELANFSRAGVLLGIVIYLSAYIIVRNSRKNKGNTHILNRMKKVLITSILVLLVLGSAIFIRAFRGTVESYTGTNRVLKSYSSNLLISPSIYLYLSSHVGVLNNFLRSDDFEDSSFGENTFSPAFHILSKFNLVEDVSHYQKGYFIPVWTNTGTYLRGIIADFGISGVFIIPYILGLLCSLLWFRYKRNGNLFTLVFLVYLYSIIIFSFLTIITRIGVWPISFLIIVSSLFFLRVKFNVLNQRVHQSY